LFAAEVKWRGCLLWHVTYFHGWEDEVTFRKELGDTYALRKARPCLKLGLALSDVILLFSFKKSTLGQMFLRLRIAVDAVRVVVRCKAVRMYSACRNMSDGHSAEKYAEFGG
jgi:hypothetical protein